MGHDYIARCPIRETKESGLTYEIRRMEARLSKRDSKTVKSLEDRISALEITLSRVGEWVNAKVRQEAQEKIDRDDRPVVQVRDEEGEVWLKRPLEVFVKSVRKCYACCYACDHQLVRSTPSGAEVCPREPCPQYGKLQ